MYQILLETDRLYFREFSPEDAPMLLEMHQDPEITRYTGDPFPWETVEQVEKILAEVILPQYENKIGRWAAHIKGTDEFIGWCGLKDIGGEIDLGYRYLQKYWGKGYAFEAAKAVLDYGVNTRKLENIVGTADVENGASVHILEKIGLTFDKFYDDKDGSRSVKFIWKA